MRDRWRIGFPEYDRYGDRGARGRDIPFKKGRWWDPYNQSVLKGDYPIKGNETFLDYIPAAMTSLRGLVGELDDLKELRAVLDGVAQ